jgi:hypothetical protein
MPGGGLNPYDHEPIAARSDLTLVPVRLAAIGAAALPSVGLGSLCFLQGLQGLASPSVDCAFHIMLGSAMLVLFADVAAVIQRSNDLGRVLLFGVLGFAGSFGAIVLAELGGPPVLVVLVICAVAWSLQIASSARRSRR